MLVGLRDRLIRNRTQLSNAIRGYAAEFGVSAAKGTASDHRNINELCSQNCMICMTRCLLVNDQWDARARGGDARRDMVCPPSILGNDKTFIASGFPEIVPRKGMRFQSTM